MKNFELLSRDEYVNTYLVPALNENASNEEPSEDEMFMEDLMLCCAYIESNTFSEESVNEGLKEIWGKIKDKSSSMIKNLKEKIGKYKAEFDSMVKTVTDGIMADKEAQEELAKVKITSPSDVLSKLSVHEAKIDAASLKKTIADVLSVLGIAGGAGTTLATLLYSAATATTGLFVMNPILWAPLIVGVIVAVIANVVSNSGKTAENVNLSA